ncbi:MAG: hypothetical protein JWM27_2313, partial [Gemmatimonadetes bacterium]|nr:hypothetical protein [Gemmatimonadota bacterium]
SPAAVAAALARAPAGRPALLTLADDEGGYRVYAAPADLPGERLIVAAGQPLAERQESLEGVRTTFAVAIPLALLLAGVGGYLLARRSLAPVVAMSVQARRIGAANLHERLPVPNPRDELGRLATVFNGLLARVGDTVEQQRRFMADAAHELRTPVAILRGEADIALSRGERPPAEYRDALGVVADESRRLSRLVDDLFLLARADAGQQPLVPTELYLNELAGECVRAMRTLAAARDVRLACEAPGDLPLRGDDALLHRLVLNLLDNAIKHSPPGSRVALTLHAAPGGYRLAVRDSGPDIGPEVRARLFERFFRADPARARGAPSTTAGAGLGLAIARWVAEAHGGTLALSPADGRGNEFALFVPAEVPAGIAPASLGVPAPAG